MSKPLSAAELDEMQWVDEHVIFLADHWPHFGTPFERRETPTKRLIAEVRRLQAELAAARARAADYRAHQEQGVTDAQTTDDPTS